MTNDLTPREIQVVGLVALGLSNEEIGERLGIATRTAKQHCDIIRRKLGNLDHRRRIPGAFRELTGTDPFTLIEMTSSSEGTTP